MAGFSCGLSSIADPSLQTHAVGHYWVFCNAVCVLNHKMRQTVMFILVVWIERDKLSRLIVFPYFFWGYGSLGSSTLGLDETLFS